MGCLVSCREGGGNNLNGQEMVEALQNFSPDELAAYILMEKIKPPEQVVRPTEGTRPRPDLPRLHLTARCPLAAKALLVREGQVIRGACVYELGVYGVFVGAGARVLMNVPVGHLLRTKLSSSHEGGVAAGFAVLGSPILVGDAEMSVAACRRALLKDDEPANDRRRQAALLVGSALAGVSVTAALLLAPQWWPVVADFGRELLGGKKKYDPQRHWRSR
jgi:hypothetical protein